MNLQKFAEELEREIPTIDIPLDEPLLPVASLPSSVEQSTALVEESLLKLKQMELSALAQVMKELTDMLAAGKVSQAEALTRIEQTHMSILETLDEVQALKMEALELVEALKPQEKEEDPLEVQQSTNLIPNEKKSGTWEYLKENIL